MSIVSRKFREFEDLVKDGSKRGKHNADRQRHPSSASASGDKPQPDAPAKRPASQASITSWYGGRAHSSQAAIDDKIVNFFVSNMISLRVSRNVNSSYHFCCSFHCCHWLTVVDLDPNFLFNFFRKTKKFINAYTYKQMVKYIVKLQDLKTYKIYWYFLLLAFSDSDPDPNHFVCRIQIWIKTFWI